MSSSPMLLSGEICPTGNGAFGVPFPVGVWMNNPEHSEGCHSEAVELDSCHRFPLARRSATSFVIG